MKMYVLISELCRDRGGEMTTRCLMPLAQYETWQEADNAGTVLATDRARLVALRTLGLSEELYVEVLSTVKRPR